MRTPPRHLLLALRLPFLLLLLLRPAASTAAQPAPAASRRAFATFSFGAVAGALRLRRLLADSDPSADRVVLVLEHAGRALVDDEGALVAAGLRVVRIAHAQYPRLGWAPHVDSFAGLANVTTYLARGEREKACEGACLCVLHAMARALSLVRC